MVKKKEKKTFDFGNVTKYHCHLDYHSAHFRNPFFSRAKKHSLKHSNTYILLYLTTWQETSASPARNYCWFGSSEHLLN